MKTYRVVLPITGHLNVEVEAESKEEAIDNALNEYSVNADVAWYPIRHGAAATEL
jgi:hypothetical protein